MLLLPLLVYINSKNNVHSKVYYDSKVDAERDGYVLLPGDEDTPVIHTFDTAQTANIAPF